MILAEEAWWHRICAAGLEGIVSWRSWKLCLWGWARWTVIAVFKVRAAVFGLGQFYFLNATVPY